MASRAYILHEDVYECSEINPGGKKFERVNRLVAKGQTYETELVLDIACEVYNVREGERFTLVIASTLRLDGKPDADEYNQDGKPSLLDEFEYGMCGKVFRYEHLEDSRVSIIASFGGLLMQLKGEVRHLLKIRMDDKVYALLRKTTK